MATTIDDLKRKIGELQAGLAEVSAGLDELKNGASSGSQPFRRLPDAVSDEERRELLEVLNRSFIEMGLDPHAPAMKPEEVQQLMLREGIKPEDNIGSRLIIEMREE